MASITAPEAPVQRTHQPRIVAGIVQFGGHLRATRLVCEGDVENILAANRAS